MLPFPGNVDPGHAMLMVLVISSGLALFDVARGVGRGLKEYLYRRLTGREWTD